MGNINYNPHAIPTTWIRAAIASFLFLGHLSMASPMNVRVAQAQVSGSRTTVSAVGTVVSPQQASIASEITGRIASINVKNGQQVNAGQSLLQLDNSQTAASLAKAQAVLQASQADFQRKQSFGQKMIISQAVIDQARSQYLQDKANFQLIQAQMKQSSITAPFAGRVSEINVSVGDTVQANQVLFQLVNLNHLRVDYSLPTRYLSWLKLGLPVSIRSNLLPTWLPGKLTYIAPNVDTSTRTVALQAALLKKAPLLRPGLFVKVRQTNPNTHQAVRVPESAINIDHGKPVVYTVVKGRIEKHPVTLGEHAQGNVAIQGIAAGTPVIISSEGPLTPGAPVIIQAHGS